MTPYTYSSDGTTMHITPRSTAQPASVLQVLEAVLQELEHARTSALTNLDRYNAYVRWAGSAGNRLGQVCTTDSRDALVLTRQFALILSISNPAADPTAVMVNAEIEDRIRELQQAVVDFRSQLQHWSEFKHRVVLDTSVFIKGPDKLEDLDLSALLVIRDQPIEILVPIVVVDELDRLKEHSNRHIRWRAGHSLAVMERTLATNPTLGRMREADWSGIDDGRIPRGRIDMHLLVDPTGHKPLQNADDEIIDRALAARVMAGGEVRLVTYDTGMAFRARANGALQVLKLSLPLDEEPPQETPVPQRCVCKHVAQHHRGGSDPRADDLPCQWRGCGCPNFLAAAP